MIFMRVHLFFPIGFCLLLQLYPVTGNLSQPAVIKDDEQSTAFSLLILCFTLILCFLVAYSVRESGFIYVHETGTTIFIALLLGVFVRISSLDRLHDLARFDPEVFFLYLLPPIIFESGFSLKRRHFFMNTKSVLLFAFLGTAISTFVFGGVVYLYGLMAEDSDSLSLVESLVFGALISATDTVTVLAIFNSLRVDTGLYGVVFGESALNDAVAIVLYQAIIAFQDTPFTGLSVALASLRFLYIFSGSIGLGVLVGLMSSLLFKYCSNLRRHPTLQILLLTLFAYSSYLLSEALHFSGIVSVFFTGLTMSHYTASNMDHEIRHLSIEFFHIVAFLCESSIFVYLGLAMFSFPLRFSLGLTLVSVLACFISRAAAVFPISAFINMYDRGSSNEIPYGHQIIMWWTALRGAMAFALALSANRTLNEHGEIILTTTLALVLFTIVILGGSTTRLLQVLEIPTGVDSSTDTAEFIELVSKSKLLKFDRRWIQPFFTDRHR